jgi:hypothetical protein
MMVDALSALRRLGAATCVLQLSQHTLLFSFAYATSVPSFTIMAPRGSTVVSLVMTRTTSLRPLQNQPVVPPPPLWAKPPALTLAL